jgi:uncharacterized protein YciI
MPHLSRDQQKAMFAKMESKNTRDSNPQISKPSGGVLSRIRQFRARREQAKEDKRRKEEERELAEIKTLESQAEKEQVKEERETKIAELKEERTERRRKTLERLQTLRREKFAKSKTGRFLAAGKKVAVAGKKVAAQLAKEAKKQPRRRTSTRKTKQQEFF